MKGAQVKVTLFSYIRVTNRLCKIGPYNSVLIVVEWINLLSLQYMESLASFLGRSRLQLGEVEGTRLWEAILNQRPFESVPEFGI